MEGIKTGLHTHSGIELLESVLCLHQIESPEDDSPVLLHLGFEIHGIFLEPGQLGVRVSSQTQVRSKDLGCEFRQVLFAHFLL